MRRLDRKNQHTIIPSAAAMADLKGFASNATDFDAIYNLLAGYLSEPNLTSNQLRERGKLSLESIAKAKEQKKRIEALRDTGDLDALVALIEGSSETDAPKSKKKKRKKKRELFLT